jgi:hypothetical protein
MCLLALRVQLEAQFPRRVPGRADDHELHALMVKPLRRVELCEPPAAEPVAKVFRQSGRPTRSSHPRRRGRVRITNNDDVACPTFDPHRPLSVAELTGQLEGVRQMAVPIVVGDEVAAFAGGARRWLVALAAGPRLVRPSAELRPEVLRPVGYQRDEGPGPLMAVRRREVLGADHDVAQAVGAVDGQDEEQTLNSSGDRTSSTLTRGR